jgi:hypothetical protein
MSNKQQWVKIYGMERSGTNYLKWMMENNLQDVEFTETTGWKHGEPNTDEWMSRENNTMRERRLSEAIKDGRLTWVVCSKDPYAWIVSFIRALESGKVLPNHYQKHDGDILRDVITPKREYLMKPNDEEYLKQYLIKYNTRYLQWRGVHDILVRYEDVLGNERDTLERLADELGVDIVGGSVKVPDERIGPSYNKSGKGFDKSYYTEERFMEQITKAQKEAVDEFIDWDLVNDFLGYRKRV